MYTVAKSLTREHQIQMLSTVDCFHILDFHRSLQTRTSPTTGWDLVAVCLSAVTFALVLHWAGSGCCLLVCCDLRTSPPAGWLSHAVTFALVLQLGGTSLLSARLPVIKLQHKRVKPVGVPVYHDLINMHQHL